MSLNVTLTALKGDVNRIPLVDVTLTKEGWAADAKATGEQLRNISGAGELSANAIAKAIVAENLATEAKAMAESASATANSAQSVASGLSDAVATAQATADAAMPIAGGTFTGGVKYPSSETEKFELTGAYLRNIRISKDSTNLPSCVIAMIRK